MKTKSTKTRPPAGPPTVTKAIAAEREPTDTELLALEDEGDVEPVSDAEMTQLNAFASTPVDFARFGLNEMAYVRRDVIDNMPVWAIHSAVGQRIGAAPTLEQAWGAILQNDLQPLFLN
jgi:hypothetical protein